MDRPVLLLVSKSGLTMGVSSGKVRFHNLLLQLLSKEVAIQEQQERFFAPGLPAGGVLSFSSPCFKLIVSGFFPILFRGTCSLVVIRAGGPERCGEIVGRMEAELVDGEDKEVECRSICCINCSVNTENVSSMFTPVLALTSM